METVFTSNKLWTQRHKLLSNTQIANIKHTRTYICIQGPTMATSKKTLIAVNTPDNEKKSNHNLFTSA